MTSRSLTLLIGSCLCAVAMGTLGTARPAAAFLQRPYFDPAVLNKAEVVVIGVSGEPWEVGEETYRTSPDVELPVERLSIPVSLQRVIQGTNVPAEISVTYLQPIPSAQTGRVNTWFPAVPPEQVCLLFLVLEDGTEYSLVEPTSASSIVRIGRAMPEPAAKPATALEAVIDQLVFSATADDLPAEVRLESVTALNGVGYYLCPWRGVSDVRVVPTGGPRDMSQDALSRLLQERVWPPLLALSRGDDPALCERALGTLVALQCPDALPGILALARTEEGRQRSWAGRIRDYRCRMPGLTSLLNPLLGDQDVEIRQAAGYALREVADESSLGYLIDALDDPESKVRYYVVCALSLVTGEKSFPSIPHFEENEAEFAGFWKDWAAKHPDRIEKK